MQNDIFKDQPSMAQLCHRHTVMHYFIAELKATAERVSFIVVDSNDGSDMLDVGQSAYLSYAKPCEVFSDAGAIGFTINKTIMENMVMAMCYGQDWNDRFDMVDDE